MATKDAAKGMQDDQPVDLHKRQQIIAVELRKRTLWFIRLRWWVPPSIVGGAFLAKWVGFSFTFSALYFLAGAILFYNAGLYALRNRLLPEGPVHTTNVQRFTYLQVSLDYAAMFLLVHFTGGVASPFIFFFIFHIVFASILLPSRAVFFFAGLASGGMILIGAAEYLAWLPHHALVFRGSSINLAQQPVHFAVELLFFTASVFIAGIFTTSIMRMLRKRILKLRELSGFLAATNRKLESLYVVVQAIGSSHHMDRVLGIVASELAGVMEVQGISIKLLSEDGHTLRYASTCGLPSSFQIGREVNVVRSPLNRKIIEGESFVTGNVTQREMFQFGEEMEEAKLQSVLFVPLKVEDRVTGILGAYCNKPNRFEEADVEFFKLAGGLVAIALENARAYESIETLIQERSKFMMRLAHNLRAPLGAILHILEVLRGDYLGDFNDEQREYAMRIDRRVRTMISMIGELLTLARSRSCGYVLRREPVDLAFLARRIEKTFQDTASNKEIAFKIRLFENLHTVEGDSELLEQMMENLVSNALKYTPPGGRVEVSFMNVGQNKLRIEVVDTGIGIPDAAKSSLFTEFFRAENAKEVEEIGTGLGLPIVQEIAERHGGQVHIDSQEGLGTTFTVLLPFAIREQN